MSDEAKEYLDSLKADPKVDIQKIFTGKAALAVAQNILFADDIPEGHKFAKKWTAAEVGAAAAVFYKRKSKIVFKFYIGSGEGMSALGEQRPLEEALKLWSGFLSK